MRFGSFVFPVSHVPENDGAVIDQTLAEIELQEAFGFDTTWLSEHHFDGASAYVDPVVFGAAVAARTTRIKIGFAVVEMAFHHPVRLAAQTALLDNLSHGRLVFGVGRGSAFNTYEYLGFDIPMDEAEERLAEAERLIVQAWTSKDVRFEGRFWNVAFPLLRPRPYQQPHPPIVRACISERSIIAMARIGRPILMGIQVPSEVKSRLDSYRREMGGAGFDEPTVEEALDQSWVARDLFVAPTLAEAREIAEEGFQRERRHFRRARELYNPEGYPPLDPGKPLPAGEDFGVSFIVGTPSQVADQVAEMRDLGVRNLMLKLNTGEMDRFDVHRSIKLFGERVMPLFKKEAG